MLYLWPILVRLSKDNGGSPGPICKQTIRMHGRYVMGDTSNRYTELLLDFGLEGLIALKWCQNKTANICLLPEDLFKLFLSRGRNRVCFSISESFGIELMMNLVQNRRDF